MAPCALVVLFLASTASAANLARPKSAVSVNYIGEGGGYTHPDPAAGGHLESSNPAHSAPTRGDGRAPEPRRYEEWTSAKPPAESPTRVVAVRPAPVPAPAVRKAEEPPRYTLWEGLAAPLKLPSAKAQEAAPDEARDMGSRDYDEHILGEKKTPRSAADPVLMEARTPSGAEMFVSVDLELKDGELKDAVAGLASGAGFRQDLRFEPAADGTTVSVWGWLAPERLGEALRSRGVARLQIDGKPRAARSEGVTTEVLLGIRLPDEAAAPLVEAKALSELAKETGYRHRRTLGVQRAPGTQAPVLVLSGEVPVRELSRLMGRGDVVKLAASPAPLPPEPRAAPAQGPAPTGMKAFAAYVASRSPILLVVTLLMMVPSFGLGLLKAVEVFIPYRR